MIYYKKISECSSVEYCKGWNEAINEIVSEIFMKVKCIDASGVFSDRLTFGEEYFIDITSLCIDFGGESLASVYKSQSSSDYLGQMCFNRFTNVKGEI